jgi:hypothetical protein
MYDARRETPTFDFFYCETVEDAEAAARRVLDADPELCAVEIFNGADWRRTLTGRAASPAVMNRLATPRRAQAGA